MKLAPLPSSFETTRAGLHQIAFFAMGPARYRSERRMGLRPSEGGFGTPEFDGRVVRVEGDSLVTERAEQVAIQKISTVGSACDLLGIPYEVRWFPDFHDPLEPVDPEAELSVDDRAGRALGQWFAFGFEVLSALRDVADGDDGAEVQLWPEHFDAAIELGSEDNGRRASYGASPGDSGHRDPYLFVSPWGTVDGSNPYWNSTLFTGSLLSFAELVSARDPSQAALDFLLAGHRILHDA